MVGGEVLGGSTATKGFALAAFSGPANPPLKLVSGTLDPMSPPLLTADYPLVTVTSAGPSVLESSSVGGVVTGALVILLLTLPLVAVSKASLSVLEDVSSGVEIPSVGATVAKLSRVAPPAGFAPASVLTTTESLLLADALVGSKLTIIGVFSLREGVSLAIKTVGLMESGEKGADDDS